MPALRQKAVHPMGEVIVYESSKGKTTVEVRLQKETLWLSLQQMVKLFGRDKSVISRHIQNILKDKELERKSVVANYATTAEDGKSYNVDYYNLDMIISVGYRVNSKQGTQIRIWATHILKQHIIKGLPSTKRGSRNNKQYGSKS